MRTGLHSVAMAGKDLQATAAGDREVFEHPEPEKIEEISDQGIKAAWSTSETSDSHCSPNLPQSSFQRLSLRAL
jgi:hypothetical protein